MIALSRKRNHRVDAGGWLCANPTDGRVRLVYTAQRTPITQHDLPDLIDRVHDQLAAPVGLVWDNHSSHTAARIHRELEDRQGASGVFLPRYAPELNPVETLWSHLKTVLANRAFRGVEELEKVMRAHLRSVQRHPGLLRGFIQSVGLNPSPFPSTT